MQHLSDGLKTDFGRFADNVAEEQNELNVSFSSTYGSFRTGRSVTEVGGIGHAESTGNRIVRPDW